MKTGKTLQELAQEIDRQKSAKRDYIADTRKLSMLPTGDLVMDFDYDTPSQKDEYARTRDAAAFNPHQIMPVNRLCRNQIASRCGIPRGYYERLTEEAPDLLAYNVNHWFQKTPKKAMLRTLDGTARAFLSERYRALDHWDMLEVTLPELQAQKGMEIISCEVTERRLYIKALFPRIQAEVKKGDVVQSGLVLSNSEVGAGSIRIEPLIYRLVCLNGMISNTAMRKYHVGRAQASDADVFEILSDKTKEISDEAFWMQVRDVIRASMNQDIFYGNVLKLQESTENKITGSPTAAIEVVRKKYRMTESDGENLLKHLIEGGDLSQYGVAQAVTRYSQDIESYDKATDLERAGGQIIELSPRDWKHIAEAA